MPSRTVGHVRTDGASPRSRRTHPDRHPFDDRYRDIGRLLMTCPDRPGIVAAVSRFLYENGANILESQQYSTDPFGGTFFVRIEFHRDDLADHFDGMREGFAALSDEFSMRWTMTRAAELKRMAIFVSKTDHVLRELLWRGALGGRNTGNKMGVSQH